MLLLRHMAHAVELSAESATLREELERVNRAVVSHENEELWLRRALKRAVPEIREVPANVAEQARAHQVIREVLDRVHREFRKPLILSGLARDLGINASYLSSLFVRYYGCPPIQYQIDLRLRSAKLLLAKGERVGDVAEQVGFHSVHYFSRIFKRRLGLAPTQFARRCRGK